MNTSSQSVNNVISCLQRVVSYPPVSPTAARSHRIVCASCKVFVIDVVGAHRGVVHTVSDGSEKMACSHKKYGVKSGDP